MAPLLLFLVIAAVVQGQGIDDPVMAGYDLVAYHSLDAKDDGIPGSPQFQTRHSNGYVYYFSSQENLDAFVAHPDRYLPRYGGFCAWGMAWEYPDDGWPWAADHMGPPCGPRDGWALLEDGNGETHLYCSIWRSYQDDFNAKQKEGMRLADQRWIEFYGSLDAGPANNGCYAWNWQDCFAEGGSIYDPDHEMSALVQEQKATVSPTAAPTQVATLFQENEIDQLSTVWSEPIQTLEGALTFQYTLEDVASVRPLLLVDLVYELDDEFESFENQYVAFGVAEHLMQGALVVCSPNQEQSANGEDVASSVTTVARTVGQDAVTSSCKTYLGSGMGISEPDSDPVKPTVLESSLNKTHYHVVFSANLFACWSNPAWPARVLFSRGLVSGNGDPMPHANAPLHRQAVPGVHFLSVVSRTDNGFNTEEPDFDPEGPPAPLELIPLPSDSIQEVEGTSGSLSILEGRVALNYGLYKYGSDKEEVVRITLDATFDPQDEDQEDTYVGFGFATDTMSGLVVTCSPQAVWTEDQDGTTVVQDLTSQCHQWRGFGTNLYPRSPLVTDGGWHVTSMSGNGTHVTYTLAGRVKDVLGGANESHVTSTTNLRAIAAIGRAAPDTGTPLMHASSRDRTPMFLGQLSAAANIKRSNVAEDVKVDSSATASTSGSGILCKVASFTVGVASVMAFAVSY